MSPQSPQMDSVDYTGTELRVEQHVTFIEDDQERSGRPRLYTGRIKLLGEEQIVIESDGRLFLVRGQEDRKVNAYYFATVLGLPGDPYED